MKPRTTRLAWRLFVNYGQGWEHESTYYTRDEMKRDREAYRINCNYPIKIKFVARESIKGGCPCCELGLRPRTPAQDTVR